MDRSLFWIRVSSVRNGEYDIGYFENIEIGMLILLFNIVE